MKGIKTYESVLFIPTQMLCGKVLSFRKQKFWFLKGSFPPKGSLQKENSQKYQITYPTEHHLKYRPTQGGKSGPCQITLMSTFRLASSSVEETTGEEVA